MTIPRTLFLLTLLLLATAVSARDETPCKPDWAEPGASLICERMGETKTGELGAGATIDFTFDLQPGSYSFAAWASLDLIGLQMTVADPSGAAIKSDNGADNQPICDIALSEAKSIKVTLKAGDARVAGVGGSYSFVSAKGSGCFVPTPCPATDLLDGWAALMKEQNQSVVKWQVVQISGTKPIDFTFTLPSGNFTAIAETMQPRDDVDILVRRGSDPPLCKNEEPDNNPICDFTLGSSGDIIVEITPWTYAENGTTTVVLLIATASGLE
jgi:hypothetical protein